MEEKELIEQFRSLTDAQARKNNIDVWGWCSLEKLNGIGKDD